MPRTRITVTVRPDLLEAADRSAAEAERSRSWVFERALERYVREGGGRGLISGGPRGPWAAGLGPFRQTQLEADLALSPAERVRLAEETARVAVVRTPSPERDRVIMFTRLEDFLEWERRESLLP